MKRAILLGLALCLLSAATAGAAVWTDTATFDAKALLPPIGPPIPFSSLDSSSADQNRLFTNGTAAFGLGAGVNDVGAVTISSASYGTLTGNESAIGILSPTGKTYVAIYGIQGKVIALPQVGIPANAAFNKGMMMIVEVNVGTFKASDPATWGFGNTPVATYAMIGPQAVLPGATPVSSTAGAVSTNPSAWPEQVQFSADQINVGALNTSITNSSQGLFLFTKLPNSDVLVSDSGQILPGGTASTEYTEGLLVKSEQTIVNTTGTTLSVAAEGVLNGIANWAYGSDFATFGSLNPMDYTPVISGGNAVATGPGHSLDFAAQLGVSAYPTLTTPEPLSVIVWAGLMGCIGLAWGFSRKRC